MLDLIRKIFCKHQELEVVLDESVYDVDNKKTSDAAFSPSVLSVDVKPPANNGVSRFDRAQLPACLNGQNILRDVEANIVNTFLKVGKLRDYKKGEKLAAQCDNIEMLDSLLFADR